MTYNTGSFRSAIDGIELATYSWDAVPAADSPRGVVQVAHGLAEHSARYDRLATALNQAGFLVRATDHRGHGGSIHAAPGDFGDAGFDGVIADVASYGASLAGEGLPVFIVAHSMGSFAAQVVLLEHSDQYAGVVLSGSTALDALAAAMADAPNDGPAGLEAFNAAFEHRTGYEWLSRDEAEVDKYVADPLCGWDASVSLWRDLFGFIFTGADHSNFSSVRKDLPVNLAGGAEDPSTFGGKAVEDLAGRMRRMGFSNLVSKVYPQTRHESLNELNRDAITADFIGWAKRITRA